MAEPVRVRRLTDQEGQRLQQIVRRGSTDSVCYRRAMMLLASACGNRVPVIAQLVRADEDTGRDVIHRFNEIGLACLDASSSRPGSSVNSLARTWNASPRLVRVLARSKSASRHTAAPYCGNLPHPVASRRVREAIRWQADPYRRAARPGNGNGAAALRRDRRDFRRGSRVPAVRLVNVARGRCWPGPAEEP
ncbi:helix-turn-helix domain-containing protein [Streptosporangium lutulentum]|uniref:helix-turn-helix domain-containing protein n=1 Tax=Streptosporangium lutulentum TaxID=1461250 RepID=UPI0035224526